MPTFQMLGPEAAVPPLTPPPKPLAGPGPCPSVPAIASKARPCLWSLMPGYPAGYRDSRFLSRLLPRLSRRLWHLLLTAEDTLPPSCANPASPLQPGPLCLPRPSQDTCSQETTVHFWYKTTNSRGWHAAPPQEEPLCLQQCPMDAHSIDFCGMNEYLPTST